MKVIVRGAWSPADAWRYGLLRANALELNYAKGFDEESSLDFLPSVPRLQRLTLLLTRAVDIAPIADCYDLEYLELSIPKPRKPINLEPLPRLTDLTVETYAAVSDLDRLVRLTRLWVGRYPHVSVEPLAMLGALTGLTLLEARKLQSLSGLERLVQLREFQVAGARKLMDISALTALPALQKLDIDNAVAVGDWSALGRLRQLRWLGFEDVGEVRSLAFVQDNELLESLFVTGRSSVGDGRVAFLADHPSLRKVFIANSAKHDATADEVRRQLGHRA